MMGVTITYRGIPKMKARERQRLQKQSYTFVGKYWHVIFRPIHFTTRGANRYRYRRRNTKDIFRGVIRRDKRGRPRAPDARPLRWSGRSFQLSKSRRIQATFKSAKVTSPVRAFNFRPPRNPNLNMREEYSRVLPSEARKLESVGNRDLSKRFRNARSRTTIRI